MAVPDGKYKARAVAAELGMSSTGNEQVGVEFVLLDHSGERVTGYFSFSDAALDYTLDKLRAAGWVGNDIYEIPRMDAGFGSADCFIVLKTEEYEGKTNQRVAFVNKTDGVQMKQKLEGAALSTFANRMKGKVLAHNQKTGKPSTPAKATVPAAEEYTDPEAFLDRF